MECVSMRATDPHASCRVAPPFRIHHPPAVAHVDAAASTYGIPYRMGLSAALGPQARSAD